MLHEAVLVAQGEVDHPASMGSGARSLRRERTVEFRSRRAPAGGEAASVFTSSTSAIDSGAAQPVEPSRRRPGLADVLVGITPLVVGGVSGVFTAAAIPTWYRTLDKPPWNPPDALFAPVWTTLYLLIGLALVLVWRLDRSRPAVRMALGLFAVQLALNFAWSWIFFDRKEIGGALVEIVVLDAAVVATVVAFWRLRRPAALLLVPYLAWSLFATLLNAEIWRLNR